VSGAERIYHWLLMAYPADFRDAYGQQMTLVFRDLRRDGGTGVQFWWRILQDTLRSACVLRWEASRARWADETQSLGGEMKTMSILAVLVGAITVVNATIEGWSGGLVNHDGRSIVAWCIGGIAGLSLLLAGVTLLISQTDAWTRARTAAIVCVAGFVLMLVVSPRMSIFANILGIGFPLALIGYVQFQRANEGKKPLMG
jgi:hypothetical protein